MKNSIVSHCAIGAVVDLICEDFLNRVQFIQTTLKLMLYNFKPINQTQFLLLAYKI